MNYKNNLVLAALFGMASLAYSQTSTIAHQRRVLDEAITTLEDYESCASASDSEVQYALLQLFVNDSTTVYNDLLGISDSPKLTASEYVKKLGEGLRNKRVTISNVRKESLWQENGEWRVLFSFDKQISYTNYCGVFFSSDEFYGVSHQLKATLLYDSQSRKCRIEQIEGSINSQKKLPEKYFVFKSVSKHDSQLTYKGDNLKFNSYGQVLLPGEYQKTAFRHADPDVEMIPNVDECSVVTMKYKSRKNRLRFHFNFGLGEQLSLKGEDGLDNTKTSSWSAGVDYGYVFPSKSNLKTAIFAGLGLSQWTIDMGYHNSDYHYTTKADVDNDEYVRHYKDLDMKQKLKYIELLLPVYLDFDMKFGKLFSLYGDLGVNLSYSLSHKVESTEGGAYIYGVYPKYGQLLMDEHWGFNGFGNKSFANTDLDHENMIGVSDIEVSPFAGVGLRFSLPHLPIAIEAGANYMFGLTDMVKPDDSVVGLVGNINKPLVYNEVEGKNSTEHIKNLSEAVESIKKQSIKLHVGMIYKF